MTALACDLTVLDPPSRERHRALLHDVVVARRLDARDLPDGVELLYPADLVTDVAEWIAYERRCCPFLTFELELRAGDGGLRLRLRGPEGTREIVTRALG